MDKTMFKAYVRELVREEVEEAVARILPKLLGEAVAQIKSSSPVSETTVPRTTRPTLDRAKMAELMGLEYPVAGADSPRGGEMRSTKIVPVPDEVEQSNPAVAAINRDYSKMMKAMGITK